MLIQSNEDLELIVNNRLGDLAAVSIELCDDWQRYNNGRRALIWLPQKLMAVFELVEC